MPDGRGFLAALRPVQLKEPVMPRFLRSPIPIAIVLIVLGALTTLPAILAGRTLPVEFRIGVFSAPALLMLFVTLPLALAGLLAVTGGVLMLRRKRTGRILATIGVAIVVLYPLAAAGLIIDSIGSCGPAPRDCANRWFNVVTNLGAAGVLGCLIAAVWHARFERRAETPKPSKPGAIITGRP